MKVTDKITITNEDNMELMARYPDNYFDLAIVDLEYCIGASKPSKKPNKIKQKNGSILNVKSSNYTHKDWDFKKSSNKYLEELFRVSKKQIIFGGNYYGLEGGYLVWDKLNGECDQFGCELAWLSFTKRTDIVYYMWSGMFQGLTAGKDIRKCLIQNGNKKENELRIHPTQKPIKLYKYIFEEYGKPNFKYLDTHHGSGSLSIAYDEMMQYWSMLGLDTDKSQLTACELDEEYYNKAVERIKNHTSQQKLF